VVGKIVQKKLTRAEAQTKLAAKLAAKQAELLQFEQALATIGEKDDDAMFSDEEDESVRNDDANPMEYMSEVMGAILAGESHTVAIENLDERRLAGMTKEKAITLIESIARAENRASLSPSRHVDMRTNAKRESPTPTRDDAGDGERRKKATEWLDPVPNERIGGAQYGLGWATSVGLLGTPNSHPPPNMTPPPKGKGKGKFSASKAMLLPDGSLRVAIPAVQNRSIEERMCNVEHTLASTVSELSQVRQQLTPTCWILKFPEADPATFRKAVDKLFDHKDFIDVVNTIDRRVPPIKIGLRKGHYADVLRKTIKDMNGGAKVLRLIEMDNSAVKLQQMQLSAMKQALSQVIDWRDLVACNPSQLKVANNSDAWTVWHQPSMTSIVTAMYNHATFELVLRANGVVLQQLGL
jgi:hypothetical protein